MSALQVQRAINLDGEYNETPALFCLARAPIQPLVRP
jgi:hypothetical protein